MGRWFAHAARALACVVISSGFVCAQTGASVSGKVVDRSGLPLPAAEIRLTAGGRDVAEARTGPDGSFAVEPLAPGSFDMEVQLSGFLTRRMTVSATASPPPLTIVLELAGFADAVVVTASRAEQPLASVPSSVGVVSRSTLERGPGLNLVETLNFVPGVQAGNVSGVDDLRISIRGAGIRSTFGSRGVVLMTDGYPVTEPDGQTPHFDGQIDLSAAERIEIVKGPASAMYGGAALGGVVNVISRVPSREPAASVRVEGGSFAFGKAYGQLSGGVGPVTVSGAASFSHLNGFREHNSLRDWIGSVSADWPRDDSRARFSAYWTDAGLDLPGTLNKAQFEEDPTQSRPIHIINDWGRQNDVVRFGGRYERMLSPEHLLEFDSFGQVRDLFHPIFVVIDQDAARYVGHARYRWSRGRSVLSVGTDVDTQWVDDRWFVNVGGQPAFQIRDDDDTVTNIGVYAQNELALGSRATLTLGVRGDRIKYVLTDRMTADGDASDVRTFPRLSPKAAIAANIGPGFVVYGNVSTGFEAPTLGEVRLPAGFNEEIKPQTAVSLETGVRRGTGRVSFDVSFFRMIVDDEILPATIDDVTVYRNVARAGHTGIEASARARMSSWLTLDGTYAYSRFTLDDFGEFSGNRLPGVPAHAGTVGASVGTPQGLELHGSLTTAGPAFVNSANSEWADAYGVVTASAAYRFRRVRVFARGDNLGGVRYTNRIQVDDASGFYYYPAPGRNGSVGVEVSW